MRRYHRCPHDGLDLTEIIVNGIWALSVAIMVSMFSLSVAQCEIAAIQAKAKQ